MDKYPPPTVSIVEYDREKIELFENQGVEECIEHIKSPENTWINICDAKTSLPLDFLKDELGVHPLTIEDVSNTTQRPKIEEYPEYIFFVIKMLNYDLKKTKLVSKQISVILSKNILITFEEKNAAIFEEIQKRIKNGSNTVRKTGVDYLAYSIIDIIIDHYFVILEELSNQMEELETELVDNPSDKTLHKIHRLKNAMIELRKAVWPLREVINNFTRSESPFISKTTRVYLRDAYDHAIHVIDSVETFRDLLSGMVDIYMSTLNNRLNAIMKVLTIIATIFIPMTFITGLYGMNFKYMPELEAKWGYPSAIGVMLLIAITMLIYFRRKRWL